MPLLLNKLQEPITRLFVKGTGVSEESAEVMASAYVDYTALALFGGPCVFTGLEKAILKATLLASMNAFLPNPGGLGGAWASGIQAFWLTPPIVVPGGVVTSVPGASSLPGAMLAITSIPFAPAEVAAAGIALAIDVCTRTAIATVAGNPVPIS